MRTDALFPMLGLHAGWARIRQSLFELEGLLMADITQQHIKVGALAAIGAALLTIGIWIGARGSELDTLSAAQASGRDSLQQTLGRFEAKLDRIGDSLTAMQRDIATIQAEVAVAKQERQRLDRELRLLKDYTEGRISTMPYRGGDGK